MSSRRPSPWCFAAGTALAVVVASPAHAQTRLDLIPFIGSYYATSPLGLQAANSEERHENQAAIGAALFVRLSQTLGIEGSFAYTPSGTNITSDIDSVANRGFSGNIIFADARVRFWFPRTNLYALAGAGIVSRGGEAWDFPNTTELTNVAGVAGFGVQAEVSPKVRVDLKIEVHVYSVDPDGDGTTYESKTVADILATVGVPIKLIGR